MKTRRRKGKNVTTGLVSRWRRLLHCQTVRLSILICWLLDWTHWLKCQQHQHHHHQLKHTTSVSAMCVCVTTPKLWTWSASATTAATTTSSSDRHSQFLYFSPGSLPVHRLGSSTGNAGALFHCFTVRSNGEDSTAATAAAPIDVIDCRRRLSQSGAQCLRLTVLESRKEEARRRGEEIRFWRASKQDCQIP